MFRGFLSAAATLYLLRFFVLRALVVAGEVAMSSPRSIQLSESEPW
jgi:hypothetical protein